MCGTAPLAIFRRIVELVPSDKLTMGTDSGFGEADLTRHRLAVHRKVLDDLPVEQAAALSHGNAERLLGLS